MKRLLLIIGASLLLMGAKDCQIPTPEPTPTPTPTPEEPPPPDPHTPVCVPPDSVSECWHSPPGGWVWNCAGGTPTVKAPAECPPIPPPPPPVGAGCEPLPGPGTCTARADMPADAKGEHEAVVDAAMTAGCIKLGASCPPGAPRPGTWEQFVHAVGTSFPAGYCISYDYLSGNSGQASEMSVRKAGATRVENYQIEASSGLTRRPPGAYRSVCEGGGEGQAIKDPGAAPPPPAPPNTCPVVSDMGVTLHNKPQHVWNVTPRAGDRARCHSIGKIQDVCPLGPEGPKPEDNAEREACERLRVGAAGPTWEVVSGTLEIIVQANPYLAKMRGAGTVKVCTRKAPEGQEPQICKPFQVAP